MSEKEYKRYFSNWKISFDEVSNQHYVVNAKDEEGRTITKDGGYNLISIISEVYSEILELMLNRADLFPELNDEDKKEIESYSINVELEVF